MPEFKLVALDLDGTLLDSQSRLSPGNAAAIAACHAAGVRVALATGKLLASTRWVCEQLGLTEPQITVNGAVLMSLAPGGLYEVHAMPVRGFQRAMAALCEFGLAAAAYTPFAIYSEEFDPRLQSIVAIHEPQPVIDPELASRETMDGNPFVKVLTMLDQRDPGQLTIEATLRERFAEDLTVVRTSPVYVEFLAPGVGKGVALARLAAYFGLDIAQVLAVGDSYNDLPMLETAGFGVAMGNAPAEVQAIARAITSDNDHDGVAEAIYRYVLPRQAQGQ